MQQLFKSQYTYNAPLRLIRLSSPNLNYIIGLGAIVLYLNVITFVIPTTNKDVAAVLCNVRLYPTICSIIILYNVHVACRG